MLIIYPGILFIFVGLFEFNQKIESSFKTLRVYLIGGFLSIIWEYNVFNGRNLSLKDGSNVTL
ncbi:hypothetical protein NRS6148_01758 [Bacillus subtilis]|nr:hypothetical protein NRS6141_02135 [Bacillus subtilis]CAF1824617.1 hypothetical protein NRS6148_01758 [Bacillus subtilis]CAF1900423.1 hypothetical protein NRS6205_02152 [Bacillus subtilis]CAF1903766.1 hypothetical protein NRS6204_02596 [Bacillus subtilis]